MCCSRRCAVLFSFLSLFRSSVNLLWHYLYPVVHRTHFWCNGNSSCPFGRFHVSPPLVRTILHAISISRCLPWPMVWHICRFDASASPQSFPVARGLLSLSEWNYVMIPTGGYYYFTVFKASFRVPGTRADRNVSGTSGKVNIQEN